MGGNITTEEGDIVPGTTNYAKSISRLPVPAF